MRSMHTRFLRFFLIFLFILSLSTPTYAQPDNLSLDQKIGQMMVVGFRGLSLADAPEVRAALNQDKMGGVILFDFDALKKTRPRNISSQKQLKDLVKTLQQSTKIPLFVMVDQEGGRVARLNEHNGFQRGLSASTLGLLADDNTISESFNTTAEQLASSGINVNLAPVVDLCINPDNPVIAKLKRCYSYQTGITTRLASRFIKLHKNQSLMTALKHFPGHGSSQGDTHLGFVDVSDLWDPIELQPFQSLIQQNIVDMVMVAHVFNHKIDPVFPASLSHKTITELLIGDLGFKGLVISDDLQMGALQLHYTQKEILYHAIMAGNDLLIFGNNIKYNNNLIQEKINLVKELINEGKISEQRIEKSWLKIKLKKKSLKSSPARNP